MHEQSTHAGIKPFSQIIVGQGAHDHFHIPKYQREYSWGRKEWEQLLTDVEENPEGYFMGSLICVSDVEEMAFGDELIYQVVDGQQRLITLSLLLMAIYDNLKNAVKRGYIFATDEDKQDTEDVLRSLRAQLFKYKKNPRPGEAGGFPSGGNTYFLRVQPSAQNHNLEDYRSILSEIGLLEGPKPKYCGRRSIYRGYSYFSDEVGKTRTTVAALCDLAQKINRLMFVMIKVGSQSDAFALFESLNNRGKALSAIDIIKNKLLAAMEHQHKVDIDRSFEQWQKIIDSLQDATEQERFLRHFYNAFKHRPAIWVDGASRATKSQVIRIYEKLIKRDAQVLFDEMANKATIYGDLLRPTGEMSNSVSKELIELRRIGASPAYQILLFLFSLPDDQLEPNDFLQRAVHLLCRYYVRRNITDIPATRDLDQLSVDLVDACAETIGKQGVLTFDTFVSLLLGGKGKPATIENFRAKLEGPIYSENASMTRYLLIQLDHLHHTRGYKPDLWEGGEKDRFLWTIEHVLPQAEKLPDDWVKMITDDEGNAADARRLQVEHVDLLGNLTLSPYNRELSCSSLLKKQMLAEKKTVLGHKIYIGYRNGLALNNLSFEMKGKDYKLATAPFWTADMIEARTKVMVDLLIEALKLPSDTIDQETNSPLALVS